MTEVILIKGVEATEMNRAEYNLFRNWTLPEDENGEDKGYLIHDLEGKKNTDKLEGYVSWLPEAEYDRTALKVKDGCLTFSEALEIIKTGGAVKRAGWNGKHLSIVKKTVDGMEPFMVIRNRSSKVPVINTWVPSSADLMAEDWSKY